MNDQVKHPSHYDILDVEAITMIAASMTIVEFKAYCRGNIMKYRLRAGRKGDALVDIGKAEEYEVLFHKYKSLCSDWIPKAPQPTVAIRSSLNSGFAHP